MVVTFAVLMVLFIGCMVAWGLVSLLRTRRRRATALWSRDLTPGAFTDQVVFSRSSSGLFFDVKARSTRSFFSKEQPPSAFVDRAGDFYAGAWLHLRISNARSVLFDRRLRIPLDLEHQILFEQSEDYATTMHLRDGLILPPGVPLEIDGEVTPAPLSEVRLLRVFITCES